MRDGVEEHRHVVPDVLGRSEWSAKRSRSECEADHERRSVGLCHQWQVSFSLVNPKRKCWIRPESGGDSEVMCCAFRLRIWYAPLRPPNTVHWPSEKHHRSTAHHCTRSVGSVKVYDRKHDGKLSQPSVNPFGHESQLTQITQYRRCHPLYRKMTSSLVSLNGANVDVPPAEPVCGFSVT